MNRRRLPLPLFCRLPPLGSGWRCTPFPHERCDTGPLLRRKMQAEFRSTPQDVLSRSGPFLRGKITELAFIEIRAEMTAKLFQTAGGAENVGRKSAVKPRQTPCMTSLQKWIAPQQ